MIYYVEGSKLINTAYETIASYNKKAETKQQNK